MAMNQVAAGLPGFPLPRLIFYSAYPLAGSPYNLSYVRIADLRPPSSKLQKLLTPTAEGNDAAFEAAKESNLHLVGCSRTEQLSTAPTPTPFQVALHSSTAVWPAHRLTSPPAILDITACLTPKPRTLKNPASRALSLIGDNSAGVSTRGNGLGRAWHIG